MPSQAFILLAFSPAGSFPESVPRLFKAPRLALALNCQAKVRALQAIHRALQIRAQGGTDMDQEDRQQLITIPEAAD
jgi:hypothetical protein